MSFGTGIVEDTGTSSCCEPAGWLAEASQKIRADFNRSSDTHLVKLRFDGLEDTPIYLKDESTHPSGSLKHRLARSLFLYGLCNGHIRPGRPIIEASSGSTAISEAYFAKLIGVPFIAVVPEGTAPEKLVEIERYGGQCHRVKPTDIYSAAEALAKETGGYYVDQFTYAERATDWRGNNNIADSIFSQMAMEANPVPKWIVMSSGTGGTTATIGRYMRYNPDICCKTRLCVVDPENSVFLDYYKGRDRTLSSDVGSRIEGIGRPRVEPSFLPDVVDRMFRVSDAASIGTIWWLESLLGRKVGGSTGTNLYGALKIAAEMKQEGETGSIISLICDSGERYRNSYFNPQWIRAQELDIGPVIDDLIALTGEGENRWTQT